MAAAGGPMGAVSGLGATAGPLGGAAGPDGGQRVVSPPSSPATPAPPGAARRSDLNLTVQGLPLLKPPYGTISAIDMDRGEILWQIPHGRTPDHIRNHPALAGLDIGPTGQPGRSVGTLVTSTLLIAGEGSSTITETGERGAMLRAYDSCQATSSLTH